MATDGTRDSYKTDFENREIRGVGEELHVTQYQDSSKQDPRMFD